MCVSLCSRACQMLARAMTRKGNALHKMGDLEGAIAAYSKACARRDVSQPLA